MDEDEEDDDVEEEELDEEAVELDLAAAVEFEATVAAVAEVVALLLLVGLFTGGENI